MSDQSVDFPATKMLRAIVSAWQNGIKALKKTHMISGDRDLPLLRFRQHRKMMNAIAARSSAPPAPAPRIIPTWDPSERLFQPFVNTVIFGAVHPISPPVVVHVGAKPSRRANGMATTAQVCGLMLGNLGYGQASADHCRFGEDEIQRQRTSFRGSSCVVDCENAWGKKFIGPLPSPSVLGRLVERLYADF